MTKRKIRTVSWIVLLIFSLVIFCSSAFIIVHANHNCTGEECPVCIEIAECQRTLHTPGTAAAGAVKLTVSLCITALLSKRIIKYHSASATLISLKVELLN